MGSECVCLCVARFLSNGRDRKAVTLHEYFAPLPFCPDVILWTAEGISPTLPCAILTCVVLCQGWLVFIDAIVNFNGTLCFMSMCVLGLRLHAPASRRVLLCRYRLCTFVKPSKRLLKRLSVVCAGCASAYSVSLVLHCSVPQ